VLHISLLELPVFYQELASRYNSASLAVLIFLDFILAHKDIRVTLKAGNSPILL
jgi:hypothetical protein